MSLTLIYLLVHPLLKLTLSLNITITLTTDLTAFLFYYLVFIKYFCKKNNGTEQQYKYKLSVVARTSILYITLMTCATAHSLSIPHCQNGVSCLFDC